MLNVDDARKSLEKLCEAWPYDAASENNLKDFINEVERLLHYNAIKQTPALFKVTKP